MNTLNLPGFSAERSLYRTNGKFYTLAPDTSYAFAAEVIPQLICYWDGVDLICGDEPFGGSGGFGGDHTYPQCRARCYRTKKGAALKECLADC